MSQCALGFAHYKTGEVWMFALCRVAAALFVLVALAACDEDSAEAPETESIFQNTTATQRETCERSGGRWGTAKNAAAFVCYRTMPDANRTCETSRDCAGICLARSRTCSPVKPFFGCHEEITPSGAIQTVCVE